jgi:hypothetical protein
VWSSRKGGGFGADRRFWTVLVGVLRPPVPVNVVPVKPNALSEHEEWYYRSEDTNDCVVEIRVNSQVLRK